MVYTYFHCEHFKTTNQVHSVNKIIPETNWALIPLEADRTHEKKIHCSIEKFYLREPVVLYSRCTSLNSFPIDSGNLKT